MKDFRTIKFGILDATEESKQYPILLENGYLNDEGVVEKALNESTFIFLGYKGSGKSALSEHLQLTKNNYSTFVDKENLTSFSYRMLGKIMGGKDVDENVKLRGAWEWVLLIKILENIQLDETALSERQGEINAIMKLLRSINILPTKNIGDLVQSSSKKILKVNLPNLMNPIDNNPIIGYEQEFSKNISGVDIFNVIEYIKELCFSYRITQKQILIIDGLDDILTDSQSQFTAVAALLYSANVLNELFRKNNQNIKIIVLCRTDIFDRLTDPNKNKYNDGRLYSFSWYKEGESYKESGLIKIANLRTQIVYPDVNDVFAEFFPAVYDEREIRKALAEYTRHTPRDFTQLLNYIQKECKTEKVRPDDIKRGLMNYSREYFVREIRDEMAGYVSSDEIEGIISLLTSLRKISFSLEEVYKMNLAIFGITSERVIPIFKVLYDCSAIGNEYQDDKLNRRYSFKYRNRLSTFVPTNIVRMHKGLWKALNLNF